MIGTGPSLVSSFRVPSRAAQVLKTTTKDPHRIRGVPVTRNASALRL
jgi:hypothetical protein